MITPLFGYIEYWHSVHSGRPEGHRACRFKPSAADMHITSGPSAGWVNNHLSPTSLGLDSITRTALCKRGAAISVRDGLASFSPLDPVVNTVPGSSASFPPQTGVLTGDGECPVFLDRSAASRK